MGILPITSAAAYGSRIGAATRWRASRLVRDDSGGFGGFTIQTAIELKT